MNSVNIIGRLSKNPEIHKTDDEITICNLQIAVDDTFSQEDRFDTFHVTITGNQADLCERYLSKGFSVGVQGRLRSYTYTDSEGIRRYPTQIVADRVQFLTWPERGGK